MTPNRGARRSSAIYTDTVRISLIENELDDIDVRWEKGQAELRAEIKAVKDESRAEIKEAKEEASKLKWWMIGNFGALAVGVLGLAIQIMVR